MGKLTYVIEQSRKISDTKYRVVLDGNVVHASHPEEADKLVRFESASDKEALATFQKVIQKYFHPRDGWTLREKKPGVADLTPWGPPPPSKEEVEAQKKNARRRQLGWAADGDVLVLELKRQKTINDLEITLDAGGNTGATQLYVLTSSDDEDGAGMSALCVRLIEGALPKITSLHVDCPWEPLARASAIRLAGFGPMLEKRRAFSVIGGVGDFSLTPAFTQPKLTTLRLMARQLDAGSVERIARMGAEELKTLQLGLAVEEAADPKAEAALLKLPFAQLDELTVVGVNDVAATLQKLAGAGRQLPKALRLDGGGKDDAALQAALAAFTAKQAATTKLSLGENVLRTVDDKTREALEAAAVETFVSPFEPQQRDEKARALWQVLA